MIARLEGVLRYEGSQIVVDCGGVGYDVICSAFTRASLPTDGARVVLRIYTQVRETEIALYGFFEHQERGLFDLLITVKNVGPSTAIAILGGAGPRDIAALIARGDVAGLTRLKGVGKKTAELLVVELREKCELLLLTWSASGDVRPVATVTGAPRVRGRHPVLDEVAGALVGLGWRPNEADAAVADLDLSGDVTIEVLLRQALRKMPR